MDITELNLFLLTPAAQVALIIGIAELLKKVGGPARIIPIVDLVHKLQTVASKDADSRKQSISDLS